MDCIKDLQDAIRNILVNNGLTELCLGEPDELDDPTYIIWYDRHCEPHEDPVLKVYLENEGIAVEVEARSFGNTITVYDYDIDRIEWWKGIHANILEVLERDGKRRCPACGRTAPTKRRTSTTPGTPRRAAMLRLEARPQPSKAMSLASPLKRSTGWVRPVALPAAMLSAIACATDCAS